MVYQYFWSVASAKFVQADLQTTSSDGLHDVNMKTNWSSQIHGRGGTKSLDRV